MILLVSLIADMISLFFFCRADATGAAMAAMPLVSFFQSVFSGGLPPLSDVSRPLSNFAVSHHGIKGIATQSGYRGAPMATARDTPWKMREDELRHGHLGAIQ